MTATHNERGRAIPPQEPGPPYNLQPNGEAGEHNGSQGASEGICALKIYKQDGKILAINIAASVFVKSACDHFAREDNTCRLPYRQPTPNARFVRSSLPYRAVIFTNNHAVQMRNPAVFAHRRAAVTPKRSHVPDYLACPIVQRTSGQSIEIYRTKPDVILPKPNTHP